jgi:hypothetical protein
VAGGVDDLLDPTLCIALEWNRLADGAADSSVAEVQRLRCCVSERSLRAPRAKTGTTSGCYWLDVPPLALNARIIDDSPNVAARPIGDTPVSSSCVETAP